MALVLVCAFDPVAELDGAVGVLAIDASVGHRLAASHDVELVASHAASEMRYVAGSAAFRAAGDVLRAARATRPSKPGRR